MGNLPGRSCPALLLCLKRGFFQYRFAANIATVRLTADRDRHPAEVGQKAYSTMPLKIYIYKHQGQIVEGMAPVVIGESGGTIGRAADNTLVLHDESVSRRHARVSFENGSYYLTDNSANGTLIVGRDLFVHGEDAELVSGDILQIGDYELKVSIVEEKSCEPALYPPCKPSPEIPIPVSPGLKQQEDLYTGVPSADKSKAPDFMGKELSIDDFFEDADEKEAKEPGRAPPRETGPVGSAPTDAREIAGPVHEYRSADARVEDLDEPPEKKRSVSGTQGASVQSSLVTPASCEAAAPEQMPEVRALPPDGEKQTLRDSPRPPDAKAFEDAYRELLERFLKGAEVEYPASIADADIPNFVENVGAVFRELVNGLWMVLRGRAELKAEMRLAMTMVRPTHNNPLKLSPGLEDAIVSLLKRTHPSFLEPVDAVREGFEDIMNHQVALGAGIQASLTEALAGFDPESFEEKNESSILQTKGKVWKAYCKAYPELKERAMEGIFGKAFVTAYEAQLAKLRSRNEKS
jgi:type VI secretion system FHA domain protein